MSEYLEGKILEEYKKMRVLRKVAKKHPDEIIDIIIKTLDEEWDKDLQKLQPPKKGVAFVTKF